MGFNKEEAIRQMKSLDKRFSFSSFMDFDSFISSFFSMQKYFRINKLKIDEKLFAEITEIEFSPTSIPFVKAYPQGIKLGNTWEYLAGLIHIQSFSSVVAALSLSPTEKDVILDIASSPGGKTTTISAEMGNKGVVVANDQKQRLPPLFSNISRLGVLNAVVTSFDALNFPIKESFTKVLVDAPCSALGSKAFAWKRLSSKALKPIVNVQKKMLLNGFDALLSGGELIYSTCTITLEENEEVVSYLLEKRENAKVVEISLPFSIPHAKGIGDKNKELSKAWRIYPFHVKSEAFFIAKIKKVG